MHTLTVHTHRHTDSTLMLFSDHIVNNGLQRPLLGLYLVSRLGPRSAPALEVLYRGSNGPTVDHPGGTGLGDTTQLFGETA